MDLARSSANLARLDGAAHTMLAEALDRLGLPLFMVDLEGRVVHRTSALEAMLTQEPEPERVWVLGVAERMAREIGRELLQGAGVLGRGSVEIPAREIRTAEARYTIRLALLGEPGDIAAMPSPPMLLSALERRALVFPPVEKLCERFELTRREAEVALLIAQRKHNAEIAEMLYISAHTARHHTERVLEKLGVHTRAGVVQVLEGME